MYIASTHVHKTKLLLLTQYLTLVILNLEEENMFPVKNDIHG